MKALEILGKENVPSTGALLIPNLLRPSDLQQLQGLLGNRPLASISEPDNPQAPADAIIVDPAEPGDPATAQAVTDAVAAGKVVIFVPRPAAARKASFNTVPGTTLEALTDLTR